MQFIVVCTCILLTGAADPESAIVDPSNTADGITVSLIDDPRGLDVVDEINNQWQMVSPDGNWLNDWMLQINLAAETYGFEAGSSESTVTVSVDGSRESGDADVFVGIGVGDQYVTYVFDIDGGVNVNDDRTGGVFMYPYCSTGVMSSGDVSSLLWESNLDTTLDFWYSSRKALGGGDYSNFELLTETRNGASGMPFTLEFVSDDVAKTLQIAFWTPTYATAPLTCTWDVSGTDVVQQDIDIFVRADPAYPDGSDEDIRISSVQVDAANVGAGRDCSTFAIDEYLGCSDTYQTDGAVVQSALDALDARSTAVEDQLAELTETTVPAIQTDVSANSAQLSTQSGQISSLESDLASVQSRATTLETEVAAGQTALAEVESAVGDNAASIASIVDTSIPAINAQIASLSTQLTSVLDDEVAALRVLIEQNAEDIEGFRPQSASAVGLSMIDEPTSLASQLQQNKDTLLVLSLLVNIAVLTCSVVLCYQVKRGNKYQPVNYQSEA